MSLDDNQRDDGRDDGWVQPMLAVAAGAEEFTDEADWAFEMKWDGVRVIARVQQDGPGEGSVTLRSRNGLDITRSYPEVVAALEELAVGSAVLDGEIVALDPEGRPSFRALQRRIHLTRPVDVHRARAEVPVQVMLFDVLALGGRSLLDLSYEDRHELLIELVASDPPTSSGASRGRAQVPPRFVGDLEAALETSRVLQLEGVVAKRLGSRYLPGSRGGAWIKIKHQRTCEVIIGGWRIGHGRRGGGIGSLAMGLPDGDQLRYVGRVGSGLSDRDLEQVLEVLQPLERSASPFVDVPSVDAREMRWVEPLLVGEVIFAGWSAQRRLWHPTWRGWRPDKDPGDVRDPDDPDVP